MKTVTCIYVTLIIVDNIYVPNAINKYNNNLTDNVSYVESIQILQNNIMKSLLFIIDHIYGQLYIIR